MNDGTIIIITLIRRKNVDRYFLSRILGNWGALIFFFLIGPFTYMTILGILYQE